MIALKNIDVVFNSGTASELKALNDVSLVLKEKEFTVVIGSNGSGKSTLLNVIAGTVTPENGSVSIDEKDITRKEDYERSVFISRIFQNPLAGTAPELSIVDNFRLASLRTRKKGFTIGTDKKFEERVKEKVSFLKLGLENNIYKPMGSLSGGQRQALTLVMGIMDDCKIMLLDEPTAALDPRSARLVMEKAEEIISTNQLTALLVTHNLKDALHYGERLLMMQEGKIARDLNADSKSKTSFEDVALWFD
ncbi:MAG: ATP-binding cassette domain-containing protein [Bacteroidota bacterium]